LCIQNTLFSVVFAESNACPMPAEYNSCANYAPEYNKKDKIPDPITHQEKTCCVCEKPADN
jgi:hypothetical protein